jgi:hypothetical protein
MHPRRHVAERRNFADVVEILVHRLRRLRFRDGRHRCLRNLQHRTSLPHLMLHRNIDARLRRAGTRVPALSTGAPAVADSVINFGYPFEVAS